MSEIILGRVKPIFKGDYTQGRIYTALDRVRYDNTIYECLNTTQSLPIDANNWFTVSSSNVSDTVFEIGSVVTSSSANVSMVKNNNKYVLNFTLPKGEKGDVPDIDFRIGTVSTLSPGLPAEATLGITDNVYSLNLGIPTAENNTEFEIGEINVSSTPDVTLVKRDNKYLFNFSLPKENDPIPEFTIGAVNTLPSDSTAQASLVKVGNTCYLHLGIPRGTDGITPNLSLGTVTTLSPGSVPTVSLDESEGNNYTLSFGIPQGIDGITPTLNVGSVTQIPYTDAPVVTIDNSNSDYFLNFGIPTVPDFAIGNVSTISGNVPSVVLNKNSSGYTFDFGIPVISASGAVVESDTVLQVPTDSTLIGTFPVIFRTSTGTSQVSDSVRFDPAFTYTPHTGQVLLNGGITVNKSQNSAGAITAAGTITAGSSISCEGKMTVLNTGAACLYLMNRSADKTEYKDESTIVGSIVFGGVDSNKVTYADWIATIQSSLYPDHSNDIHIALRSPLYVNNYNTVLSLRRWVSQYPSDVFGTGMVAQFNAHVVPGSENYYLGYADDGHRWKGIYAVDSEISTSDARYKENISNDIPDTVLEAVSKIPLCTFNRSSSVREKGTNARIHTGIIAQDVKHIFAQYNIDPSQYAFFCHDTWDAHSVEDKEGNHINVEAGDMYSIRYTEFLVLEAAYQRKKIKQLESMIQELKNEILSSRSKG